MDSWTPTELLVKGWISKMWVSFCMIHKTYWSGTLQIELLLLKAKLIFHFLQWLCELWKGRAASVGHFVYTIIKAKTLEPSTFNCQYFQADNFSCLSDGALCIGWTVMGVPHLYIILLTSSTIRHKDLEHIIFHLSLSLGIKATVHLVTTMLATSKNVLFSGRNHLLTTGADDPSHWLSPLLALGW